MFEEFKNIEDVWAWSLGKTRISGRNMYEVRLYPRNQNYGNSIVEVGADINDTIRKAIQRTSQPLVRKEIVGKSVSLDNVYTMFEVYDKTNNTNITNTFRKMFE